MANDFPFPVSARDVQPLLLKTLLDRGAMIQPENLVVTRVSQGYTSLTYREHNLKAKQLASALEGWGVKLGDRVATLMWNSAQHLQCYHAISCMGAILHTLNLRLSAKDLGVIINHGKDRMIIADADLLGLLGTVDEDVLGRVEQFVCCGADWEEGAYSLPPQIPASKTSSFEALLRSGSPQYRWPDFPETTLHALCYTSGTTGMPKGAAYSHRSTYLHSLCTTTVDQLGLGGSQVLLAFVPMFHVLCWGIPFVQLMLGTRTVFTGRHTDSKLLLDALLDWKVTVSNGVPTVWQGVQAAIEARGVADVAKTLQLKLLSCGGSAIPLTMMDWYWEKLGVQFCQQWGMTETNPVACIGKRVARHVDLSKSPSELNANTARQGFMLPGLEVRIADPENLDRDVPQGSAGEMLVRGPWVITEYFQVETPDKFHNGWLITGDVAKLDEDGAVVLTDRSKDVIKSGGEWISSMDMEGHIVGLPDVSMCAVVAVPHPRWDERPVAVVVPVDGVDSASKDAMTTKIKDHCLKIFAKFQLPDDILLWPEIPMTSTGKIDKKRIRQRLAEQGYVLPTLAAAAAAEAAAAAAAAAEAQAVPAAPAARL